MPKIAYYAPLKPPDHPIPSGDRQMAIMLMSALGKAGYEVELASRYISYSKRHSLEHLEQRKQGAKEEAIRLLEDWQKRNFQPDLWFCYHPYDKSPDWLGMEICTALSIPMVTAEPCKTGQGPNGEWVPWREEAQRGILMADMNIVMTHSDLSYLRTFVPEDKTIWMPPFIDPSLLASNTLLKADDFWHSKTAVKLLAVGMMRPGAKMQSYEVLAGALRNLSELDWELTIAGGGPGTDDVQNLFEFDKSRINIVGEQSPEAVISLMQFADILTWPGCREAYGMVYLEAAAHSTPCVALDNMGVPLVVEHGKTGLLANPDISGAYSDCLRKLIHDVELRIQLGKQARHFVEQERSAEQTALRLKEVIDPILAN